MSALDPAAREQLIYEIVAALRPLSGVAWEPLGHRLAELLTRRPLLHRGQGIKGNPSSLTIDSFSESGDVAVEYGTADDYFSAESKKSKAVKAPAPKTGSVANATNSVKAKRTPKTPELKKPREDYAHVRKELPGARSIYLLSTQEASPAEMTEVTRWSSAVSAVDKVDLRVYDSRRLAVFIVDELFEHEAVSEELARRLPPLRRARDLHAATNTLAPPRSGTVARPELEEAVERALDAHGIALIAGMSGFGKSRLANAVANRLRDEFAWPIWTSGLTVDDVSALAGTDVSHRGLRLNLQTMLATRSCLVVLDDLQTTEPLREVLERLRTSLGSKARVIVTSQHVIETPYTVGMTPMPEGLARRLLEQEVGAFPDDVFRSIWNAVGGHPMALRLLNGLAQDGAGWKELVGAAQRAGVLASYETARRLVDSILATRRNLLEKPLGVFLWAGSPRVHVGVLDTAAPGAERVLRRFGLVADDQPDTIRLHDVVWSSLNAFEPPLGYSREVFEEAFDQFVAGLARSESRTMTVNHIARVHEPLLSGLVRSGAWRPGHLYAWLHGPRGSWMDDGAVPDANGVAENAARGADAFLVQVASELAEAAVVVAKRNRVADEQITSLLKPFQTLLESPTVPATEKIYVRHHKAKALKRLGRHVEAVTELEDIVRELGGDAITPPVVRLLLARVLTELPKGVDVAGAGSRARELLLGLLDEATSGSAQVSTSATLAAAELLRRRAVDIDVAAYLPRYADLLEPLVVAATRRGLVQGALAFGALAATWRVVDGDAFWRIFEELPLPSVPGDEDMDVDDRNAMAAWGEILVAAAAHDPDRSAEFLEASLAFFQAAPTDYARTHAAKVLTRLGRASEAVQVLEALLGSKLRDSDRAWTYRWLAEANEALGDRAAARTAAQQAYDLLPKPSKYESEFSGYAAKLSDAGAVTPPVRMAD